MPESEKKLLLYRSGQRTFGITLAHICEVLPAFEMTGVPGLQLGVIGLVGLRGEILPVIDADALTSEHTCSLTAQHKFIILKSDGRRLALLAEHIDDIIVMPGDPDSSPGYLADDSNGIERVFMHEGSMVLVLDLTSLISLKDFHQSMTSIPHAGTVKPLPILSSQNYEAG